MQKDGCVRITERAADGVRRRPHREPLQQSGILRMVGKGSLALPNGDREGGIWQNLNRIGVLHVGLAIDVVIRWDARELPGWNNGVGERIVKRLGDFMGKRDNVRE